MRSSRFADPACAAVGIATLRIFSGLEVRESPRKKRLNFLCRPDFCLTLFASFAAELISGCHKSQKFLRASACLGRGNKIIIDNTVSHQLIKSSVTVVVISKYHEWLCVLLRHFTSTHVEKRNLKPHLRTEFSHLSIDQLQREARQLLSQIKLPQ